MKAFMVAGDRSGSGKTSITLAIASLLSQRLSVQTFKVGMDYIDTSYHTAVTGRPCRNLDSFVLSDLQNSEIFAHGCEGADIAIIEGVRGLYEGAEALADTGSSASIAKLLGVPVILVVDARSITRSAAAMVNGFISFDPAIRIAGVIVNNVTGEQHKRKVTAAIETFCKIPVLGTIPRFSRETLTMRHLGLVPYLEGKKNRSFQEMVSSLAEEIARYIDLDALLTCSALIEMPQQQGIFQVPGDDPAVTIAVARDEAFNFYYADLFDLLPALYAKTVFFSPIHDPLPDADGYIFGGGYPEYYAQELEYAEDMRMQVKDISRTGVPIYAECGGLIYLTESLTTKKGWQNLSSDATFEMAGVFSGTSHIPARRVVSYVVGETSADCVLGYHRFRGHAFHYSDVMLQPPVSYSYTLSRGVGIDGMRDGASRDCTIAGYTHLHPVASRDLFGSFCNLCLSQRGNG